MPYRPDCNGIEYVWKAIKLKYRQSVENYKARNKFWHNQGLIENLIDNYGNQEASSDAC